jgi:thiol-disulfide isomerase/thioredoxin
MRSKLLLLLITGLAGAGAGWWFTEAVLKDQQPVYQDSGPMPGELIGQVRPDFTLGSVTGEVLNASDFDGDVLLINFWATWCKPCREEMPMLSELHEEKAGQGFQVVGVALDDVQQARDFVADLGIGYPNLVGGADVMATGVMYGNRAGLLPYSVLIDRQGIIRWSKLGPLETADLNSRIEELL